MALLLKCRTCQQDGFGLVHPELEYAESGHNTLPTDLQAKIVLEVAKKLAPARSKEKDRREPLLEDWIAESLGLLFSIEGRSECRCRHCKGNGTRTGDWKWL